MGQFNKLTPAQAERLFLLLEELGEAQQAIGKILRHGYDSWHPEKPACPNRVSLECELGDIGASIILLTDAGDLDFKMMQAATKDKLKRIKKWMHHQ